MCVWCEPRKLAKAFRLDLSWVGFGFGLDQVVELGLGCVGDLCGRLHLSHSLTHSLSHSLPLSLPSSHSKAKPKHYSLLPSSLDLIPRSALASRRIGRGGSPRSRLRVDAKFASFRQGLIPRVGKGTLYRGERSVPDKTSA